MFGGIALPELLIFALVVLLLFGKRLPATMKSLGSSIRQFKAGMAESGDAIEG